MNKYLGVNVDYDIVASSRIEMPHTVVTNHINALQLIGAVFGEKHDFYEEDIDNEVVRYICEETTELLKSMPDLEQKILMLAFGLENPVRYSLGTISLSLKMPHRLIYHRLVVSLRRLKHPARLRVLKKIVDRVEQHLA